MVKQNIEKLEVHPLIAAQEQSGETTIEFCGFVGSRDDETLRLYTDLGMSSYLKIPKEAVVHVEEDLDGVTGKVRVFVSSHKLVTEVYQYQLQANASLLSVAATILDADLARMLREGLKSGSTPPMFPWVACVQTFVKRAAQVRQMWIDAELKCGRPDTRPNECDQAMANADRAANQAVSILHQCLTQVQPRYLTFFFGTEKVAEIVDQLTGIHLPRL